MFNKKTIISIAVCALLLGAMAVQISMYPAGDQAAAYHQAVKRIVHELPSQVGNWKAKRVPMPPASTELLRPNVQLSRRYTNTKTGKTMQLLLVQCTDARDMVGHYPANCYPAFGWTTGPRKAFSLKSGDITVTGETYHFKRDLGLTSEGITVMNVILLPQGKFGQGMADIQSLAASYRKRFYGAGQIQMIFNNGWTKRERRSMAKRLLSQMDPLMEAMLQEDPVNVAAQNHSQAKESEPVQNQKPSQRGM